MRTTETRTVMKETTEVVKDAITCDMCGAASAAKWPARGQGVDWLDEPYDFHRTEVAQKTGHSYPEGGRAEGEAWHICPGCWNRLSAWIAGHRGATATVYESDW